MIRFIEENDIYELISMRICEQKEIYGEIQNLNVEFNQQFKEFLLDALKNPNIIALVYVEDSSIVATCMFNITQQPPQLIDNGRYAYMCNAYTKPKYRRRGIQKKLFLYAKKILNQLKVSSIYLDSTSEKEINFILKNGFIQRDDYYSLKL